jgi:hypothetical protein
MLRWIGNIIIVAIQNNICDNFREGPLGHKKERYQYQKVTQLEGMQDLTLGGGFSLLNEVATSLGESVSSVSNFNLTIAATSMADMTNQSSKDVKSQSNLKMKGRHG